MKIPSTVFLMLSLALAACAGADLPGNPPRDRFVAYWYPHGAEISRFELEQARYGNLHKGDAVLIFVTESLNPETRIKADRPGPLDVPVLKLNATRKFYTGIYPYSIMTSTFTPVDPDEGLPMKISTSVQEWCGHVYIQLTLEGGRYRVRTHSYFESDGESRYEMAPVIPEDALWNRIRIAPADLPVGRFPIIPGTLFSRFAHQTLDEEAAVGRVSAGEGRSLDGNPLLRYEIRYPDGRRRLAIVFEEAFPHRIQRWEETQPGLDGELLTTRAERTHTLMIDYWNHHAPRDRDLLQKLGLTARP